MGVRYDVFTKASEKYGNFANFDLGSFFMIVNDTGGMQNNYHDFSSRFGFDATIGPGTVLRGGFGLTFYVGDTTNNLVLNNAPVGFNTGSITNTTPLSTTGIAPVTVQSTSDANLFGAVISKPLKSPDPYLEQFNLVFQKELHETVFTLGYVAEVGGMSLTRCLI